VKEDGTSKVLLKSYVNVSAHAGMAEAARMRAAAKRRIDTRKMNPPIFQNGLAHHKLHAIASPNAKSQNPQF
jgi:hypothetical protein